MTGAGYSETPLGRKLGYRGGMRVFVDGMPDPVRHAVEKSIDARPDWQFLPKPALEARASALLPLLAASGFIWVSWPKKASKVPTDITEDTIRDVCLPMGLVDVKVCAIDATWSGLKLTRRRS